MNYDVISARGLADTVERQAEELRMARATIRRLREEAETARAWNRVFAQLAAKAVEVVRHA